MSKEDRNDSREVPSPKLLQMLHDLEYLIGSECYNGNIQNYGPGGVWEGQGRGFRYPVRFRNSKGKIEKYHGELPYTRSSKGPEAFCILGKQQMNSAHYAFGANELHVFRGLMNVLQHLEKRFGLSFEQMLAGEETPMSNPTECAGSRAVNR